MKLVTLRALFNPGFLANRLNALRPRRNVPARTSTWDGRTT